MFGLQSSQELTALQLPKMPVLHLHIRIFFTLFSKIKSEKTHIHTRTHTHTQCTSWVLYQECLKLVSSSLKVQIN